MTVRIWGCRGSLPTPGKHTLRYGGNTTCIEVRLCDDHLLLIDAGSGRRRLGNRLMKEGGPSEMRLLLTHAHWDHLLGFPFFVPAYVDRFKTHVRGGPIATSRLSVCEDADLVVVMRNGRVQQVGTHEHLLAEPGTYRHMYLRERDVEELTA